MLRRVQRISLDQSLLVAAFRRALGRDSTLAPTVVDELIRVWDQVTPAFQTVIERETRAFLRDHEEFHPHYVDWRRLIDELCLDASRHTTMTWVPDDPAAVSSALEAAWSVIAKNLGQ